MTITEIGTASLKPPKNNLLKMLLKKERKILKPSERRVKISLNYSHSVGGALFISNKKAPLAFRGLKFTSFSCYSAGGAGVEVDSAKSVTKSVLYKNFV